MKITDLKKKDVIHCPTKEQFEAILKITGSEINPEFWNEFKKETCYNPSKDKIDYMEYYKRNGKSIHPADRFLIPSGVEDSIHKSYENYWRKNGIFPQEVKSQAKDIDNVTTDRLHNVLRILDINIPVKVVDRIIDVVELIEQKAGAVSLDDIKNLEEEWERSSSVKEDSKPLMSKPEFFKKLNEELSNSGIFKNMKDAEDSRNSSEPAHTIKTKAYGIVSDKMKDNYVPINFSTYKLNYHDRFED